MTPFSNCFVEDCPSETISTSRADATAVGILEHALSPIDCRKVVAESSLVEVTDTKWEFEGKTLGETSIFSVACRRAVDLRPRVHDVCDTVLQFVFDTPLGVFQKASRNSPCFAVGLDDGHFFMDSLSQISLDLCRCGAMCLEIQGSNLADFFSQPQNGDSIRGDLVAVVFAFF